MKSPLTGKAMVLRQKEHVFTFRKEQFRAVYQYYFCEDSEEEFVDTSLGDLNLLQVHNQYRSKHNLPFPEQIIQIREQYGLPATKMGEILGFGVNSYGNYERGEVPSLSNAKMIQLAGDPKKFRELVLLADSLTGNQKEKLLKKVDQLIVQQKAQRFDFDVAQYLMPKGLPNEFTGFREPSLEQLTKMVVFFANTVQPWKTKLNKLLFYADFLMFKHYGYAMSGTRYRAIDMGPVPHNYQSLFEYLENQGKVEIDRIGYSNSTGEQFKESPTYLFKEEQYHPDELAVLREVAQKLGEMSTTDIIELSHQESAWLENEKERKIISYAFAFQLQALQ